MKDNAKAKILVEIAYLDFKFDDVNEAVKFAEIANKAMVRNSRDNKSVTVTITFKDDEEVKDNG